MKKRLVFLSLLFLTSKLFSQAIIEISDRGWRLWPDRQAMWENDKLYLPGEFNLSQLPVNAPTGGWDALNQSNGKEVELPATVEQHYWGEFGFMPYKDAYGYENGDKQVVNGNYKGVSWWWKSIDIPQSYAGKKVLLKIRGARLRAEVYLNHKLVGYHIITETAFDCDLSSAILPGKPNLLAIRITNPGGQMDWIDPIYMKWGSYEFHRSHGFGGLDRGITIEAHDNIFIHDLWVLNHPELNKITAYAEIINTTNKAVKGSIRFDVHQNNSLVKEFKDIPYAITANDTIIINEDLIVEQAAEWNLTTPILYSLKAENKSGKITDTRSRGFGFRWFDAEGIGEDAILTFNHKRIRMLSAISWGFWGLNGIFPTPELAKREVTAAKTLGLNCIQFHRNIGKTEVFDQQDQLGLLRYMEPGGGRTALEDPKYPVAWGGRYNVPEDLDTTGKNGQPNTFAQKYMEEKIIRMVRDHRSHPSLVMYVVQNEMCMDPRNPRIWYLLKRMHAEDPSRTIVLHSGVDVYNEEWMKPYNNRIFYDKNDGVSGWTDQHTVGGPGIWKDELYKGPSDFTHRSVNKKEIVMWGEMLGAAVPDNHQVMVDFIKNHGNKSYDLKDHEEILDAYNQFIDKWGFRKAFPTASDLFTDISRKSYDFWGRVIEATKLSEENDYLVISGWESTAIENHSGLVDNQRNFRCEPTFISERVKAVRPVVKPHALVVEPGQKALMDLFLINESNQKAGTLLTLTMTGPDGKEIRLGEYKVPAYQKNQYVYPIIANFETPPLAAEGSYKLKFVLDDKSAPVATDEILVVNPLPDKTKLPKTIAIIGDNELLVNRLKKEFGINVSSFDPKKKYDLIIASHSFKLAVPAGNNREIDGTDDDPLYQTELYGDSSLMQFIIYNVPKGKATVTLKFTEVWHDGPKQRLFDIAINGQTVEKDFDIFGEAGGQAKAIDKVYTVTDNSDNMLISFPRYKSGVPKLCAFKVEAGGKTYAYICGNNTFTDKSGLTWKPYEPSLPFDVEKINGKTLSTKMVFDVVKSGTPLLLVPKDEGGIIGYGKSLERAEVCKYNGYVGRALQPWMGSWVFVREHDIFNGLPANCALKSHYQVGANDANALMVDGNNIEIMAGYGRDHNHNIGAATFVASYGKSKILFQGLYGISPDGDKEEKKMQPIISKRLLYNSLVYLNKK